LWNIGMISASTGGRRGLDGIQS